MTENGAVQATELPDGWVWATIGDITQPITKVNPSDEPEKPFTYLDISSIDNRVNVIKEPKAYYGEEAPSRARQLVEAHDVLFSTVRTYLKNVAVVPDVYDGQIASTGFSVLRGEPGILSSYLFYYSLTDRFLNALNKLQRGTSYPAVRDGDVRARPIPLVPSAEQRRIVEAIETQFTRLDAAVAALGRARAALARYKASVLKAACEGRLVPTEAALARAEGRAYEPADVLLTRILAERRARWEAEQWAHEVVRAKKQAALERRKAAGRPARVGDLEKGEWEGLEKDEYAGYLPKDQTRKGRYEEPAPPDTSDVPDPPEGWIWVDVAQLIGEPMMNGRSVPDATNGFPVLRLTALQEGRVDLSQRKTGRWTAAEAERYLVQQGDFFVSRGNGSIKLVGRGGMLRSPPDPVAFPDTLIRIRISQEHCLPERKFCATRAQNAQALEKKTLSNKGNSSCRKG